jgi:enamine deaminase RidA (YjgF/YER057c/UK114 family)
MTPPATRPAADPSHDGSWDYAGPSAVARAVRRGAGGAWEDAVGCCRVVRAGALVFVPGTTATDAAGQVVAEGDAYGQAQQALRNVAAALATVGAGLADVVQTRVYVTDVARWPEVHRAHAEAFCGTRPAATMVAVAALLDPRMLVEIEAVAVAA